MRPIAQTIEDLAVVGGQTQGRDAIERLFRVTRDVCAFNEEVERLRRELRESEFRRQYPLPKDQLTELERRKAWPPPPLPAACPAPEAGQVWEEPDGTKRYIERVQRRGGEHLVWWVGQPEARRYPAWTAWAEGRRLIHNGVAVWTGARWEPAE